MDVARPKCNNSLIEGNCKGEPLELDGDKRNVKRRAKGQIRFNMWQSLERLQGPGKRTEYAE